MFVWEYDGSFEGMLTVVYEWFYTKIKPEWITTAGDGARLLFTQDKWIASDDVKAQKVLKGIYDKLGEENFERVLKVFLSEAEGRELIIVRFLEEGFKIGKRAIEHLSCEAISTFHKLVVAYSKEEQKMYGLIRFQILESEILYSGYETKYNLLPFLASHFAQRLGNQIWVLHDLGREEAAFYQNGKWHIHALDRNQAFNMSEDEKKFQALWQTYYKHIAIEERKNHKLRMQFMPKKYWKYLTELSVTTIE